MSDNINSGSVNAFDPILSGETVIDLEELESRDTSGEIDNLVERVIESTNHNADIRSEADSDLGINFTISMKGWSDLIQISENLNEVDLSTIVVNLNPNQILMSESSPACIHVVNARIQIPFIQGESVVTQVETRNSNNDSYKGVILIQILNDYTMKSFIPYDNSNKKIVAFYNKKMIYHVGVYGAEDIVSNIPEPTIARFDRSILGEVDRIIIDSKFTKKKVSAEWVDLVDALYDIEYTSTQTTDPNYIKKMWELNLALCQNNA